MTVEVTQVSLHCYNTALDKICFRTYLQKLLPSYKTGAYIDITICVKTETYLQESDGLHQHGCKNSLLRQNLPAEVSR